MDNLPLRAASALGGTAAYLGLAILGWGGFAGFFAHPGLIALTIVLCAVVIAAMFAGGNMRSGEREDRGNRWVLSRSGSSASATAICRHIPTASICGPSTAMPFAGSA